MPDRRIIRNDSKFFKTFQIRVILDPQVGAGDLHAEAVPQFLSGHLHAIQYRAGRSFAYGVQVNVQSFLIQFFKDLRKFFCIDRGSPHRTGVYIRRNHCRGFDLHGAVHKDL